MNKHLETVHPDLEAGLKGLSKSEKRKARKKFFGKPKHRRDMRRKEGTSIIDNTAVRDGKLEIELLTGEKITLHQMVNAFHVSEFPQYGPSFGYGYNKEPQAGSEPVIDTDIRRAEWVTEPSKDFPRSAVVAAVGKEASRYSRQDLAPRHGTNGIRTVIAYTGARVRLSREDEAKLKPIPRMGNGIGFTAISRHRNGVFRVEGCQVGFDDPFIEDPFNMNDSDSSRVRIGELIAAAIRTYNSDPIIDYSKLLKNKPYSQLKDSDSKLINIINREPFSSLEYYNSSLLNDLLQRSKERPNKRPFSKEQKETPYAVDLRKIMKEN